MTVQQGSLAHTFINWVLRRKTPEQWLRTKRFQGVRVLDPDGWRMDQKSWDDPLSRSEFYARLMLSTGEWPKDFWKFISERLIIK